MFCPKCGTKIEEGKRYCSNCGYDTNTENTEVLENEKIDNEVLETENINNELIETKKTNNNETNNNQSNVVNMLNTNENQNNVEINKPINNSTININSNPNNNNKTAIIFMLSIIAFIILFLVAIYLVFFAEDNKVEKSTNKEVEIKEEKEEINKDTIEAKIKTNNGTITFLVPEICANSNIYDTNNNYKSYSSTNLECLSINFTYIDYENAEEGQEATAENPYMTEYNMEKMTVELNNGVKVPALKITDNLGSVFYPVSDNSHIEISISLNEFTEQEIKKYVIVKE